MNTHTVCAESACESCARLMPRDPFARLAAFPECPAAELAIIAHAILAAHLPGDICAGLRTARRLTGLDAVRWLSGAAFADWQDDGDLCAYPGDLDALKAHASVYLGEVA